MVNVITTYLSGLLMRREAEDWLKQAREDLKTAFVNLKNGRYYASVFFSQQAGEKALKASYIDRRRMLPARKHNMVQLSRLLRAPSDVVEASLELNPEYLVTRYPDAAGGVPEQMYNRNIALVHLRSARRILKWVRNSLKSKGSSSD